MSSPDRRPAFTAGKVARPHPAAPTPAPATASPTAPTKDEGLVMLCVRVPPTLRRRLKVVSAASGLAIQDLVTVALEDVCRQHDM